MNLFSFQDFATALALFGNIWFFLLPPLLYPLFRFLWMDYVQGKYAQRIRWTVLEIIPPEDIEESPQPMESVYAGMAGILKSPSAKEEFIDGYFTEPFSLEMEGRGGGEVHLYVVTPSYFRNLVEAHLYAQYPRMEIREVSDYTRTTVPPAVPNQEWDLWGTDFELVDPDPLPIRTYRFFEEDVTGKMIDPLAGLIETMGKLPHGQKIWLQYVIIPLPESWRFEGREFVEELIGRKKKPQKKNPLVVLFSELWDILRNIPAAMFGAPSVTVQTESSASEEEQPLEFRLTPGEKKQLEALESNIGKNVFRTKMRMIYVGKREGFNKTFVGAFIGGIKQFADQNLNSFKPDNTSKTFANYFMVESRLRFGAASPSFLQ